MNLASLALGFLLTATIAVPATAPSTRPSTANRILEFVPAATPDEQAWAAGAVPFYNDVAMSEKHWVDYFTGWGDGRTPLNHFKTAEVRLSEHDRSVRFRVLLRGDEGSRFDGLIIEWEGTIADGKVTGDVRISAPGPAVEATEIAAELARRRKSVTDKMVVRADGTLVDDARLLMNAPHIESNLVAARGRTLRFTFNGQLGMRIIPPPGGVVPPEPGRAPAR